MKRTNIARVLAVAFALGATACDNTPTSVVEPSSLAPRFSGFSSVARSMTFTENFNLKVPGASMLETTGAGPSYSKGVVIFQPTDRGYLRTIAGNYNTTSFKADITVTVVGGFPGTGSAISFFGLGRGEPNCSFYCEPDSDPSIYGRILPSEFFGHKVELTNVTSGLDQTVTTAYGQGGDGTHRLQISWNHTTREVTFAIQTNHVEGTEFVPTAVLGPFAVGDAFDGTNAHIFFGGAGNTTFDNLHVTALPK